MLAISKLYSAPKKSYKQESENEVNEGSKSNKLKRGDLQYNKMEKRKKINARKKNKMTSVETEFGKEVIDQYLFGRKGNVFAEYGPGFRGWR